MTIPEPMSEKRLAEIRGHQTYYHDSMNGPTSGECAEMYGPDVDDLLAEVDRLRTATKALAVERILMQTVIDDANREVERLRVTDDRPRCGRCHSILARDEGTDGQWCVACQEEMFPG